jgi:hypothetical protein
MLAKWMLASAGVGTTHFGRPGTLRYTPHHPIAGAPRSISGAWQTRRAATNPWQAQALWVDCAPWAAQALWVDPDVWACPNPPSPLLANLATGRNER